MKGSWNEMTPLVPIWEDSIRHIVDAFEIE